MSATPSAADRAEALFLAGHACSQSVVLSLCEGLGMPRDLACRASLGLGGGIGRLREVCGAVSGMAFLAGLRHGLDHADEEAKRRTYRAVQEMAAAFRKEQGTLLCRDILGLAPGDAGGDPEPRSHDFYERRHRCLECIRLAASIAERTLNFEQAMREPARPTRPPSAPTRTSAASASRRCSRAVRPASPARGSVLDSAPCRASPS